MPRHYCAHALQLRRVPAPGDAGRPVKARRLLRRFATAARRLGMTGVAARAEDG
jgi:hypothetical protein